MKASDHADLIAALLDRKLSTDIAPAALGPQCPMSKIQTLALHVLENACTVNCAYAVQNLRGRAWRKGYLRREGPLCLCGRSRCDLRCSAEERRHPQPRHGNATTDIMHWMKHALHTLIAVGTHFCCIAAAAAHTRTGAMTTDTRQREKRYGLATSACSSRSLSTPLCVPPDSHSMASCSRSELCVSIAEPCLAGALDAVEPVQWLITLP